MFAVLSLLILFVESGCHPVPFEMVDMTYKFDNETLHWPEQPPFQLDVEINGTVDGGYWLQLESYFSGVHVGTHMDAPCHFARGRWCIDVIPLQHLVAPAAVIDISDRAEQDRDAELLVTDLMNWEAINGDTLENKIILMNSGWGKRWGNREAYTGTPGFNASLLHFPGMSPQAAQWLVNNRHIYGFGTDTLSLDHGITRTFMTHRILLDKNIFGLENVANVDQIPSHGATLYVLPMKIANGSGGPVRIVATFPKPQQYRSLYSDFYQGSPYNYKSFG